MNGELEIKKEYTNIQNIALNPDEFSLDVCVDTFSYLDTQIEQLSKLKKNLKDNIISRMKKNNATIIPYGNGEIRLVPGKIVPTKGLEEEWSAEGFIALEVGDYVFKPSWSKAKEVKKLGGKKSEIIDKYFVRLTETLENK